MVTVNIVLNTNGSKEERKDLYVSPEVIEEFTCEGFGTNAYDGKVVYECFPRAVNPDIMQIIIDIKDLGETIIAWGAILHAIYKLIKRSKGYTFELTLIKKKKDNDEEKEKSFKLEGDMSEESLVKLVKGFFEE